LQDNKPLLSKDLFAPRGGLYEKIKIPLKTLDKIICVLVGLLIIAIILGIGSNRLRNAPTVFFGWNFTLIGSIIRRSKGIWLTAPSAFAPRQIQVHRIVDVDLPAVRGDCGLDFRDQAALVLPRHLMVGIGFEEACVVGGGQVRVR